MCMCSVYMLICDALTIYLGQSTIWKTFLSNKMKLQLAQKLFEQQNLKAFIKTKCKFAKCGTQMIEKLYF